MNGKITLIHFNFAKYGKWENWENIHQNNDTSLEVVGS